MLKFLLGANLFFYIDAVQRQFSIVLSNLLTPRATDESILEASSRTGRPKLKGYDYNLVNIIRSALGCEPYTFKTLTKLTASLELDSVFIAYCGCQKISQVFSFTSFVQKLRKFCEFWLAT